MSKSLRLSEKWYRRGLWLVAFVFAGFLIGLGSTIVGDLPRVEKQLQVDDFIDRAQAEPLRASIKAAGRAERDADEAAMGHDVVRCEGPALWAASRLERDMNATA